MPVRLAPVVVTALALGLACGPATAQSISCTDNPGQQLVAGDMGTVTDTAVLEPGVRCRIRHPPGFSRAFVYESLVIEKAPRLGRIVEKTRATLVYSAVGRGQDQLIYTVTYRLDGQLGRLRTVYNITIR